MIIDTAAKTRIEAELRSGSPPLKQSGLQFPLPPPSSEDAKWWETHQPRDIPNTKGSNPFYDFEITESVRIPVGSRNDLNLNASSSTGIKKPVLNLMD